jgi:hypothetical protein
LVRRIDPDEVLCPADIGLTEGEQRFVAVGLAQWGGIASAHHEPAVLAGYASAAEMERGVTKLRRALATQDVADATGGASSSSRS